MKFLSFSVAFQSLLLTTASRPRGGNGGGLLGGVFGGRFSDSNERSGIECCTWDYYTCTPSGEWCGSSQRRCNGCGGIWADLSQNPPGCCSWWEGQCGQDAVCNSHPDMCEGSCSGSWIDGAPTSTASPIASTDAPAASPVESTDAPTTSPVHTTNAPIASTDAPTASPIKTPNVPTASPVKTTDTPTASPIESTNAPTESPIESTDVPTASPGETTSSPTASPGKGTSAPVFYPAGANEGILTMWTSSHPGPLEGSSCEYAQPASVSAQPAGTTPSWLVNYVEPKMYCAVSEDLFEQGVGCGKCYRVSYDGNPEQGSDPGRAGSAEIQVVNSGAGGEHHFDCFVDAHEQITGTTTGIFTVSYDEIPCEESPLTVVVLDPNNAYYVKVLFAGGTTGVAAATITVGGVRFPMSKISGATWAAGLQGSTQAGVQFDVTFADGSTETLYDCYSSQWPASNMGEQCAGDLPPTPEPGPTPVPTLAPTPKPVPTSSPTAKRTAPTVSPVARGPSILLRSENAMSIWEVFQGLELLTYKVSDSESDPVYALQASGGAASDVVSEGQGYALLVTGITLAAWDAHTPTEASANMEVVKKSFYGYFNGWKKMCQLSSMGSCQTNICKDKNGVASVCLPGWKMSSDLTYQIGSGAASDGDIDAITGMIFAVKAFEALPDSDKPFWYDEVFDWIDQSATAFMSFNVDSSRSGHRILKLGSCWGGWEGNGQNPSYHSPGGYKMLRDFQMTYPAANRVGYSGFSMNDWDELIDTSYEFLSKVQCPDKGMVPNWARITTSGGGGLAIDPGSFSGSGTPQYEFGSEASRTIWRLSMDAAVYPEDISHDSGLLIEPMVNTLRLADGESWSQETFPSCTPPGMGSSVYIFGDWLWNAFIFGPVLSSLIVPDLVVTGANEQSQQELLELAADKLAGNLSSQTSYFSRCWILLSNLAINGALESAGAKL